MQITIKGVPLQKQSARFAKRGNFMMKYQPKKLKDWISQARMQIINQVGEEFVPLNGPIVVRKIDFCFPPLRSFPKYKIKALEEGQIIPKDTQPDLDNLMKNLFDVCNGLVWVDDAKIIEIVNVRKRYDSIPRIDLDVEGWNKNVNNAKDITKRTNEVGNDER